VDILHRRNGYDMGTRGKHGNDGRFYEEYDDLYLISIIPGFYQSGGSSI
jgi:hypothetical protein